MRIKEFIVEYQGGAWRLIRGMVPAHWPDYVVKDWLYSRIPDGSNLEDKKYHIEQILKNFPVRQWRLENRKLTLDSFIPKVQENLIAKMKKEDTSSHFIPRDEERHATQASQIQSTGQPSQEPVICLARGDKLELVEGWHRTTQNLLAFPDGYQARAWVGYL